MSTDSNLFAEAFDFNPIQEGDFDSIIDDEDLIFIDPPFYEEYSKSGSNIEQTSIPSKETLSSLLSHDWMTKLATSQDLYIKSLTNQLAYLSISNAFQQGLVSDMEQFGQNSKLAEIDQVTLMAAIFGSAPIMQGLANAMKCAMHEIVFPAEVYEMRKFLRDNFVKRTFGKTSDQVDHDWFHHAESKKTNIFWGHEARSDIKSILKMHVKTKDLILDIQALADFIKSKKCTSSRGQNFSLLNELNMNVRDDIRIIGRLNNLETNLNEKIFGQKNAVNAITSLLGGSFGRIQNGPLGIATFIGPSESGKSMLAEQLCQDFNHVFRLGFEFTVINMEQFNDERSTLKLFGSGSQYVNSSLGDITAPIFAYPRNIILLDEIEKAHPAVLQSLLAILDKGEARDATNHRVSNCVFRFVRPPVPVSSGQAFRCDPASMI